MLSTIETTTRPNSVPVPTTRLMAIGGNVLVSDLSTLILSEEPDAIVTTPILETINPVSTIPDNFTYPVTGWSFIEHAPATVAGNVSKFHVKLANAENARKVIFGVFRPTANANEFNCVYASDEVIAAAAGTTFLQMPNQNVHVAVGDYIGVQILNTDTANGIRMQDSGGSPIGGGWTRQSGFSVGVSSNYDLAASQFKFCIDAVVGGTFGTVAPSTAATYNERGHFNLNLFREPDLPWFGKRILWLGTSIPANFGATSYPNQIAALMQCTVLNQAVGSSGICWNGTRALSLGATQAELTGAGFDPSQSYQSKALGKTPDLVVFDHLYNDRGYPQGTIDSTDKSTRLGAMNFVIQALYAENPLVEICFLTPPTRFALTGEENANFAIRDDILALAAKYDSPVLDLMGRCGMNEFTESVLSNDDLHPNQFTTNRIARKVYAFLKSV